MNGMNWVIINSRHYNVEQMQEFYWYNGALVIHMAGRSVPEFIHDPDKRHYNGLCFDLLEVGS